MKISVLETILDKLYEKYLIPMVLVNEDYDVVHPKIDWNVNHLSNTFLTNLSHYKINLVNNFKFMFGSFSFKSESGKNYQLLVGPCGLIGTDSETYSFQGHIYHSGIHFSKEDFHSFEEYMKLLYSIVNNEILDKSDIHWTYLATKTESSTYTDKKLEDNLYDRRVQEATLDSYQFELRYIEYIKRNQPEKIKWLFKKMRETYRVELAPNELEGLKYKFSAFVAILTRISIDEGVPINQAFSLSDSLIQGLSHIHSVEECLLYLKDATYRFIEVIHSYPYSQKSLLIKLITNYIDEHIYDKITIDLLASVTQKHKTHVAAQFKKEMGQTIHRYIQERKISEAKHLLLFTDHSYREISILLSFSSQSHFIQVFKNLTGCTPKEYKNVHYPHCIR